MAITSWTSEGMDWTSADTLRLQPLANVLEAIRLAIRERQLAAGLTPSGYFVETYDLHLLPAKTFADAVQSAMTDLITRYVNHTDNGGDWNGVAFSALAPAWTAAALIEAIEAESRLTPDRLSPVDAWAFQQYQMLNMLRWTKHTSIIKSEARQKAGSANASSLSAAYNAALAEMNSASWSSSSTTSWIRSCGSFEYNPDLEEDHRYYANLRMDRQRVSAANPSPFEATLDFYAFPQHSGNWKYWFEEGYGGTETEWLAFSRDVSVSASAVADLGLFVPVACPLPAASPAADDPDSYVSEYASFGGQAGFVFKPALTFKDW